MPAPEPSARDPSLPRRLLGVDDLGPAAGAPRPLARATVLAVVTPFLAWLALMGAIAVAAGTGPDAIEAGGWRITAYRDVSAAAFAAALVVSAAMAAASAARGGRP